MSVKLIYSFMSDLVNVFYMRIKYTKLFRKNVCQLKIIFFTMIYLSFLVGRQAHHTFEYFIWGIVLG